MDKVRQRRTKVRETLRQYRNEHQTECLLLSSTLCERLDALYKKGIDREYHIALKVPKIESEKEKVKETEDPLHTLFMVRREEFSLVERKEVEEFKYYLNHLNNTRGNKFLRHIKFMQKRYGSWCNYPEFCRMSELLFEMEQIKEAIENI